MNDRGKRAVQAQSGCAFPLSRGIYCLTLCFRRSTVPETVPETVDLKQWHVQELSSPHSNQVGTGGFGTVMRVKIILQQKQSGSNPKAQWVILKKGKKKTTSSAPGRSPQLYGPHALALFALITQHRVPAWRAGIMVPLAWNVYEQIMPDVIHKPGCFDLFAFLNEPAQYRQSGGIALPENWAPLAMQQMAGAMAFLHNLGITYLDIKAENILIEQRSDQALRFRMIDLDGAHLENQRRERPHYYATVSATPIWFLKKDLRQSLTTEEMKKADIFALCLTALHCCLHSSSPESTTKQHLAQYYALFPKPRSEMTLQNMGSAIASQISVIEDKIRQLIKGDIELCRNPAIQRLWHAMRTAVGVDSQNPSTYQTAEQLLAALSPSTDSTLVAPSQRR
jgi:serine/threonine protein kinase